MTILRVGIHEIGEEQTTTGSRERLLDLVHPLVVALRVHRGCDTPPGKEILDFSDGVYRDARLCQRIEQSLAGRWKRVVAAVRRATERPWPADERPRDDAADVHSFSDELVGNL